MARRLHGPPAADALSFLANLSIQASPNTRLAASWLWPLQANLMFSTVVGPPSAHD
jgi:hypothetical protein